MNDKQIAAKIERSSLGTRSATAARRTVSSERSGRIVASAAARRTLPSPRKSGG